MNVKNNGFQRLKEKYYERQAKKNKGFVTAQTVCSLASMPASIASIGTLAGMRKVSTISQADSVELPLKVQHYQLEKL